MIFGFLKKLVKYYIDKLINWFGLFVNEIDNHEKNPEIKKL